MKKRRLALIVGEGNNLTDRVKAIGYDPVVTSSRNFAKALEQLSPSFVLIDLPNGQSKALQILASPAVPVFVVQDPEGSDRELRTDHPTVQVLDRNASPGDFEAAIRNGLRRECGSDPQAVAPAPRFSDEYLTRYAPLLSGSPKMAAIKDVIEKIANTNATILVRGETGVGKDLIARAVHAASDRHAGPFVKLNCAALPADLLESELFGHEKGAFTGAHRRKLGKFEFANQGTIFLDEIGELPLSLQAKLLHVLEDFQFSRIGGREMIHVDTRIVAATNRHLEAALHRGEFREDLFFRLAVVEIHVPPLRERRETILGLANGFLDTFRRQYRRHMDIPPTLTTLFVEYEWPGNVRELENAVRRLVVLGQPEQIEADIRARRAMTIATPKDVSALAQQKSAHGRVSPPPMADEDIQEGLKAIARRAAHEAERQALATVLERVRWNRLEAARILKVSYKTLLTKISELKGDLHS
jgi:two-component system, NtrC family, response regulator AtoC